MRQPVGPVVLFASLVAVSSLRAAGEPPGGKAEQATIRNSASASPLSIVAPDTGIRAPQRGAGRPTFDVETYGAWKSLEIAPSPDILERMKGGGPGIGAQSGCTICMSGNANAAWSGDSGSFQLDRLTNNRSSGTSGTLELVMRLTAAMPVWGSNITSFQQSAYDVLGTLGAGYYYYAISSGTIPFYNSSIPAGTYYELMMALEYQGGSSWTYTDYIVFPHQVLCDGSGRPGLPPQAVLV